MRSSSTPTKYKNVTIEQYSLMIEKNCCNHMPLVYFFCITIHRELVPKCLTLFHLNYNSSGVEGGAGCAVHTPERTERGAKRAFQGGAKISLMFNWAICRPSIVQRSFIAPFKKCNINFFACGASCYFSLLHRSLLIFSSVRSDHRY